jgi:hypothetical protein
MQDAAKAIVEKLVLAMVEHNNSFYKSTKACNAFASIRGKHIFFNPTTTFMNKFIKNLAVICNTNLIGLLYHKKKKKTLVVCAQISG